MSFKGKKMLKGTLSAVWNVLTTKAESGKTAIAHDTFYTGAWSALTIVQLSAAFAAAAPVLPIVGVVAFGAVSTMYGANLYRSIKNTRNEHNKKNGPTGPA